MTSILQAATSAVENEIAFNLCCHDTAKYNLLLAYDYVRSTFTGTLIDFYDFNEELPIALKDRCINFIKASLLLLRAPLFYIPLINRVTQLALCFLSPRKAYDFATSSPFGNFLWSELSIRYNENAFNAFVEKCYPKNIRDNNEFETTTNSIHQRIRSINVL